MELTVTDVHACVCHGLHCLRGSVWVAVRRSVDDGSLILNKRHAKGYQPMPRAGHAAVVSNKVLYIHGGHDGRKTRADLVAFDLATARWTKISAPGRPAARHSHTYAHSTPSRLAREQ